MREFLKATFVMLLIIVAVVLVGVLDWKVDHRPSVLDRAKAASFELGVNFVFELYTKKGWEQFWPAFARRTGAILGRPDGRPVPPSVVIFYTQGGGTAWFFGQDDYHTYALTNEHVVNDVSARKEIIDDPAFEKIAFGVSEAVVWLCPNFSNFDEFPSCKMNVDPALKDNVLDFAVVRFSFGRKTQVVTTLALGSYEAVPNGADLITIGAGVGINDLEGPGKKLPVRPPYLPAEELQWRWIVPYDMNTVGGFSGSAVVDLKTGLVIGLHKGAFLDPRGSGRAVAILIPIEFIAKVLITHGFPVDATVRLEDN